MLQSLHLEPGARLERYEILWPIAEGGMGAVWLARLTGKRGFEKLVAIKTILPQHGTDERFEHMLLDEGRIASRIEHPNVAQILDLGEHEGMLYLVMEWIDGESVSKLHRALRKKDRWFSVGVALRIVADACAGLHAAHELRDSHGTPLEVVHRDVSPQNVLVARNGSVKVIDFGIAKAIGRMAEETKSGGVKGKLSYMAPEQAFGDGVDRRTDVWAIAAVLYFLLSGHAPYESDNQMITLSRLNAGAPPPALPVTVPEAVAELVFDALSLDPEKRPPSAAAFQRRIEEAMTSAGVHTNTSDVAAFLEANLPERAVARREILARAIGSAEQRAHRLGEDVQPLRRPSLESAGPTTPLHSGVQPSDSARARSESESVAAVSAHDPRTPPANGATAGSAALVRAPEQAARRDRLLLLGAAGGVGIAALVASLFWWRLVPTSGASSGQPSTSAAASAPPADTVPTLSSSVARPVATPSSSAANAPDASVTPRKAGRSRGAAPERPWGF